LRLGPVEVLPVYNSANGFYDVHRLISKDEFTLSRPQDSTGLHPLKGEGLQGLGFLVSSCPREDDGFFPDNRYVAEKGFTLPETLIAMMVLTFGLLGTGQLIYVAMSSTSLARSKASAALVAQSKLDFLADLYRQNPGAPDLTDGAHGPEQVEVTNPSSRSTLNRYNVAWKVAMVPDPRAGRILKARQVTVTVTPVGSGGRANSKASLNKVVNLTTILSARVW
jgi:prepilin-type N-terminal cleavage/methylation domain-containing protein